MIDNELTYWVALMHTPKIRTTRKNEIVVHSFKQGKTIIDFFESKDYLQMELNPQESEFLSQTKSELANYAFLVEELVNQGYDIIPITSKEYSPTLKANLKYNAPIILYTKGNKQILQEDSIAIVGSRNANEKSLQFTDNVAKKASSEFKVVVSGFAKGVDKQALDSALLYKGQSIIVLPQGITTFTSGIKKYYRQIIEGNLLVLSTFHPKSPWSVELAMARNSIIYGLASTIYAAQSDVKGGTWSGVCEGLKKNRLIYVRKPQDNENCANNTLINMGAKAVDMFGTPIEKLIEYKSEDKQCPVVAESIDSYNNIDEQLTDLLKRGVFSAKQIIELLNLKDCNSIMLSNKISKIKGIRIIKKGGKNTYTLQSNNDSNQLSLIFNP